MPKPNVAVIRAAGVNCEEETAFTWSTVGASPRIMHVNELIAQPAALDEMQIVTVPGGFSYGDDIASGRILANQLKRHLGDPLRRFVDRGGLLLGICNGFQALVKAGLLPGAEFANRVTVTYNDSGRYEDRWVYVEATCDHCAFVQRGQRLRLPVAHGEGKVVTDGPATLGALRANHHVALRYCDAEGRAGDFPINPNGSEDHIAGLTDPTGRILGLMPHPERAAQPTNLPDWTRTHPERGPGLSIFENAVRHFR